MTEPVYLFGNIIYLPVTNLWYPDLFDDILLTLINYEYKSEILLFHAVCMTEPVISLAILRYFSVISLWYSDLFDDILLTLMNYEYTSEILFFHALYMIEPVYFFGNITLFIRNQPLISRFNWWHLVNSNKLRV